MDPNRDEPVARRRWPTSSPRGHPELPSRVPDPERLRVARGLPPGAERVAPEMLSGPAPQPT